MFEIKGHGVERPLSASRATVSDYFHETNFKLLCHFSLTTLYIVELRRMNEWMSEWSDEARQDVGELSWAVGTAAGDDGQCWPLGDELISLGRRAERQTSTDELNAPRPRHADARQRLTHQTGRFVEDFSSVPHSREQPRHPVPRHRRCRRQVFVRHTVKYSNDRPNMTREMCRLIRIVISSLTKKYGLYRHEHSWKCVQSFW